MKFQNNVVTNKQQNQRSIHLSLTIVHKYKCHFIVKNYLSNKIQQTKMQNIVIFSFNVWSKKLILDLTKYFLR